jgi:hypothetical protein
LYGVILSGAARTDVPLLCNFLEILLGLRPKYDSNDADGFSLSCECFFIADMSPTSHAAYLKEKVERLQANRLTSTPTVLS